MVPSFIYDSEYLCKNNNKKEGLKPTYNNTHAPLGIKKVGGVLFCLQGVGSVSCTGTCSPPSPSIVDTVLGDNQVCVGLCVPQAINITSTCLNSPKLNVIVVFVATANLLQSSSIFITSQTVSKIPKPNITIIPQHPNKQLYS